MMRRITEAQASAAYDILVRYAGARDDRWDRYSFVHAVTLTESRTMEYRFGGNLGWGGKFRNNGNRDNTPHVDCYREHETPERLAVIASVNAALGDLFATPP